MKTIKTIFTLLSLLLITNVSAFGQGHWAVPDEHDFQYDMTVYAKVLLDEKEVDPNEVELAAFVGDELRGVAEPLKLPDDTYIYYMRVRSNTESGEKIVLKAFADGEELDLSGDPIIFDGGPDSKVGSPHDPYVAEATTEAPPPAYTLGDVDGDGAITGFDVSLVIAAILQMELPSYYIPAAADMDEDGTVSGFDVSLIIDKILSK